MQSDEMREMRRVKKKGKRKRERGKREVVRAFNISD